MPADCTERIKACRVLHSAAHQLAPFEKVNKFMDHKPILALRDLGLRHDRIKKKKCLDKDKYVTALKTTSLTHNFVRDVEHALEEHMSFFEIEQHRVQPDAYNEKLMNILQTVALQHFAKTHNYTQAHTEISNQCVVLMQKSQKLKEIVCTH
jgi:hypothetical protein